MKYTAIETPQDLKDPYYVPAGGDAYCIIDENGKIVAGSERKTLEHAQLRANSLNEDESDDGVFDIFFDEESQIDYFGPNTAKRETVISELEDEIGLEGQYEVGQEVLIGGVSYIVSEVLYIDDEDADEMHDVRAGWNANARRKR